MSNTIDVCETGYDYEQFQMNELENENMKLKKQLEIATKALKEFKKAEDNYLDFGLTSSWKEKKLNTNRVATEALKEMEGIK